MVGVRLAGMVGCGGGCSGVSQVGRAVEAGLTGGEAEGGEDAPCGVSGHCNLTASCGLAVWCRQVGNTPGVTKAVQEVVLDKHIKLLDSPGVVFASAENDAAAALRNAIKVGEGGHSAWWATTHRDCAVLLHT